MAELESLLAGLRDHAGVDHVLLVGRDGLLIHHTGDGELDEETFAALVPGVASACGGLGGAAAHGEASTVVVEWNGGVGIVAAVSDDLLLTVLLRPDVGFAPLLRSIREQRGRLAELV